MSPQAQRFIHLAGITLAFLLMSYAHVVIGEVVPKNLAIEKADRLALLVAPALLIFDRISAPFRIRSGEVGFGGVAAHRAERRSTAAAAIPPKR